MSYQSNIPDTSYWFAGEDKTLSYEVFDTTGVTMEDVSGFDLRWTGKLGSKILTKTSNATPPNPGGITITGTYNSVRTVNTQRVIVTIADTDTESLPAGRYSISLKRLDAGTEAVLSHGYADLQEASIR